MASYGNTMQLLKKDEEALYVLTLRDICSRVNGQKGSTIAQWLEMHSLGLNGSFLT